LALNNTIQLADSIAAAFSKLNPEASDDTSDEDLNLGAPKFFSGSSSTGKNVKLPPKVSRISHANVKSRSVEQVLPTVAAPQKPANKPRLKRSRAVIDSHSDDDQDSQVGTVKKERKKSKKEVAFEYDSEEDIADRNNSLKMLFP
jgi:hypothetical protein